MLSTVSIFPSNVITALKSLPDADLLLLGERLDIAIAEEILSEAKVKGIYTTEADEIVGAAYEKCSDIVDRISEMSATSMEGLAVKAKACAWCHGIENFKSDTFSQQETTDVVLVSSILNDLLKLKATPEFLRLHA